MAGLLQIGEKLQRNNPLERVFGDCNNTPLWILSNIYGPIIMGLLGGYWPLKYLSKVATWPNCHNFNLLGRLRVVNVGHKRIEKFNKSHEIASLELHFSIIPSLIVGL